MDELPQIIIITSRTLLGGRGGAQVYVECEGDLQLYDMRSRQLDESNSDGEETYWQCS
jgi:hypothetical protein